MGEGCDDALAHAIDGLFKAEVITGAGPRRPFEAVGHAALDRAGGSNHRRPLEPVGDIPPAEAAFHASPEATPMAAWSPADQHPGIRAVQIRRHLVR